MITLKVYDSFEQDICEFYARKHNEALQNYNLSNIITSNTDSWLSKNNSYIIVAILESTQEIVGGIRLKIRTKTDLLPLEKAILHIEPNINSLVLDYEKKGHVGEVCALWIDRKKYSDKALSMNFFISCLVICEQLKVNTLLGFISPQVSKICSSLGFKVEESLVNQGCFYYPNKNYISKIGSLETKTLEKTEKELKVKIFNLRKNLNTTETIEENSKKLTYKYELELKGKSKNINNLFQHELNPSIQGALIV